MRLLALGLFVLALAAPASAQIIPDVSEYDPGRWFQPACPRCRMESAVDWVQQLEIDGLKRPVIAGWGFECESGRPTDRVEAFAWDPKLGIFVPVQTDLRWRSIARGDVYADKVGTCPRVSGESGFGAIITGQLPEGTTMLQIQIWRGPYHTTTALPVFSR